MVAAVPMVAMAFALRRSWELSTLPEIALAMALSTAMFPILGWWLVLDEAERQKIGGSIRAWIREWTRGTRPR
jgi:hypothetical protein